MCITLADADRIVEARRENRQGRAGRLHEALRPVPGSACSRTCPSPPSRFVTSASWCTTPSSCRSSRPARSFAARTSHPTCSRQVREQMRAQVRAAVGDDSPAVITAFEGAFLGSLVHDVNVVHGLLERLGEPLPAEVLDGDWWNEGQAVTGAAAPRKRRALGQRLDSAPRRVRVPRVGGLLFRRRGAHAQLSVTLAQAVADALRSLARAGRRAESSSRSSRTRRASPASLRTSTTAS